MNRIRSNSRVSKYRPAISLGVAAMLALLSQAPRAEAWTDILKETRSSPLSAMRIQKMAGDGHFYMIYKKPFTGARGRVQSTHLQGIEGQTFGRLDSVKQPTPGQEAVQWDLAAKESIKIMIKEEGWYRVTQPELLAVGLDPAVNPKKLQLYVDGQEQAIRVVGQDDKRFDPEDFIEFYATGVDTPFTDTRTYWLIKGNSAGLRIKTAPGEGGEPFSGSFPLSLRVKERTYYLSSIKNGEKENFFGPAIAPAEILFPGYTEIFLETPNLDPSPSLNATLEIAFQGWSFVPHRVSVLLNGSEVGNVFFDHQDQGIFQVQVRQSDLNEEENKITLIPKGGDLDVSFVDYIQFTYWHTLVADNDFLKLTAQGGSRLTIKGFSRPNIRVIDFTDPLAVREVKGDVALRKTGYAITFKVPRTGTRRLMAFTNDQRKTPARMVSNKPSNWHDPCPGYDLVIISHRDFLESLQPLKQWRESQELAVALIDVEDLYDEFNFGMKSPQAIKDFLGRTRAVWDKAPRFVLFVGDASFDPRNYFGVGDYDFLPTKLIDSYYLEAASDDWFVDFDEDGLPEMAVGRLPVRTAEEATTVVSKILGYEELTDVMNVAVFVADLPKEELDYEAATEEVEQLIPSGLQIEEIFRSRFDDYATLKNKVLSSINQGPLLVNYIGDGSIESWENQVLYTNDAQFLTNGPRLPFFVHMTCLNGYFIDPSFESLAEALLQAPNGGAVTVWASSGLNELEPQVEMNKELYRLLFDGTGCTLGEAAARAKSAVEDPDVRRTWIFFGDPSARLNYPTP